IAASSCAQFSRRLTVTTAGASGRWRAAARTSPDSDVPSDTGISFVGAVVVSGGAATRRRYNRNDPDGVAWTDCNDVVTMGLAPQYARGAAPARREGMPPEGPAGRRGGRSPAMPSPRPPCRLPAREWM